MSRRKLLNYTFKTKVKHIGDINYGNSIWAQNHGGDKFALKNFKLIKGFYYY